MNICDKIRVLGFGEYSNLGWGWEGEGRELTSQICRILEEI